MAKPPRAETCPHCGGHTVRVSWSSLKTHEECRQRGALHREGKRSKITNVRNFFPGRVTDRVVRYWLEDDPRANLGVMPDMVRDIVERELASVGEEGEIVDWRHKTDKDDVIRQCEEAVRRIEPALERYVLPYSWMVDFGFRTPVLMRAPWGLDQVILNGYMDIIVRDPETDSWRIYDVKHTANKDYWKGSFGQLVFYSYENQIRTGNLPLEVGFFQPLVAEGVKRFKVTDTHVNVLAGRIQSMAYEVWSGMDFPRSDNTLCNFCDAKHACVKFKPVTNGKGRRVVPLDLG